MIPFFDFRWPGISCYSKRRDDQWLRDYHIVQNQFLEGGQCDDGLASAEAHVQEQCRYRMVFDVVDTVLLVFVWHELHMASPPLTQREFCNLQLWNYGTNVVRERLTRYPVLDC